MNNNLIQEKSDREESTIALCNKYGLPFYTLEEYRKLIISENYNHVKINKKFRPIWRKSELNTIDANPTYYTGFNYALFCDDSVLPEDFELLNKCVPVNFFYVGYAVDGIRPLAHVDKRNDSCYKFIKSLLENTSNNIYIAILTAGLLENEARDGEGIIQTIMDFEQFPGGNLWNSKVKMINKRIQSPKTLDLFGAIPEFTNYKCLF